MAAFNTKSQCMCASIGGTDIHESPAMTPARDRNSMIAIMIDEVTVLHKRTGITALPRSEYFLRTS